MRIPLPNSARLLPFTLALVAALALAGGVAFAAHLAAQPGVGASTPRHPGTPAIDVTLPGQVPAFTEADVRAYYTLSHGYPGGRAPDGSMPPIQSVTFMPATQAELTVTRGDRLGLPAGATVCVVTVRGPIRRVISSPRLVATPIPTATPDPKAAPSNAYMVFDAATGNLLAYGG